MLLSPENARDRLTDHGQDHVLRFWDDLNENERLQLVADVAKVDFRLMDWLIYGWVIEKSAQETFDKIEPIDVLPIPDETDPAATEAKEAGEDALRTGRVGILLVAGGQGTRLGFDGPKGAYPIGPISKKTLFGYHAEKIRNLQNRFGCVLPWYIMVSSANHAATKSFFRANDYFGLAESDVIFFEQAMMPCVDPAGKFMLESTSRLAMNPNGHGGCLQAVVDNKITNDAANRGVDTLTYFQVDNWAVHVADPYFIGYHVLRNADMSSKIIRKNDPREGVAVHCICDGEYRVIEYSELDMYPQLLETDESGNLVFHAGNPAIHAISVNFIERVCSHFDLFPWHRAYKKIPYINETGQRILPNKPNAYKFETFVFDALRFTTHKPVALELNRPTEFTPVKQPTGTDSVQSATKLMTAQWAEWLDAAGQTIPRDKQGQPTIKLDISPEFALTKNEFIKKSANQKWPTNKNLQITPTGKTKPA